MAITKFIKDLFVVDVEEEVPAANNKAQQTKAPAKVTNLNTTKNPNNRPKETSPNKTSQASGKAVYQKTAAKKAAAPKSKPQKQQEKKRINDVSNKENRPMPANDQSTKVCLFEPRVFAETQDIADELKSNRAALVNLTKIDAIPKKRIVDFLSGTVYALEGDIQKVGADIFLCTPNSFGVEGEISDKEGYFDEM